MTKRNQVIQELQTIPGVGIKIAENLWNLEIHSTDDLKSADPDQLYKSLCNLQGMHVDRCMLYVFRCACYFAQEKKHNPELLKWWNWSDQNLKKRKK